MTVTKAGAPVIEFENRIVVITGGATGIGFALAKALGKLGAHIIIAEPRIERLREACASLKSETIDADYFVCDVSDLAQVEALADFAFSFDKPVAAIINNAGIGIGPGAAKDQDVQSVRRLFDVNFFGVVELTHFVLPWLKRSPDAHIVNISSSQCLI